MKRGKARLHASDIAGSSLVAEARESGGQGQQGGEGDDAAGAGAGADGGDGEAARVQDGRAIVGAEWLRVPLTDNTVVEKVREGAGGRMRFGLGLEMWHWV